MLERQLTTGRCAGGLLAALLLAAMAPEARAAEAVDDAYTLEAGATLNVPAPGVLFNDSVRDDFVLQLVTPPAGGELSLAADGGFTYVHGGGGSDSFTYRVEDDVQSSEATVTLTVVDPDAPEAVPNSYTVAAGGTLEVPAPGVLSNDEDPNGDPLTAILESPPLQAAEFSLAADGSFVYVHDGSGDSSDGDGGGDDSFTYRASDGSSTSSPVTVTLLIDRGTATPASLSFTFSEVAEVAVSSYVGGVTHLELGVEAPATRPASAQGEGVPSQVVELVLRVTDVQHIGAAAEQFGECQRLALVAQARPELYLLRIALELSSTVSIVDSSTERVMVSLPDGMVRCHLQRLP